MYVWSPKGRFTSRFNMKKGDFDKNDHFEFEICLKARGGRAARCMGALLAGPRRHQTTPRPRQDRPLQMCWFFIKNVDFSLEKCRFGAHRGVLHYVLKRELALPRKTNDFELEICAKERGGRTALQPQASLSLK